ncbi:hypothetical protein [Myxococcus sp. CA039A]|uniref:hypothetical protein n=1 Tax=Myxococcus sp. CA039A TaxID=2741737 RepID=UPI00157AC42D|nr:hypothetical protein [Myxococcus sp. CA039A]NTX58382.1 hypothetical protein [Myxococcus sp. CA039A]
MIAKPIQVTILSAAGDVLGELTAKPSNALWRARKEAPKLFMTEGTRECERYGEGWALRLREGERPPGAVR